MLYVPHHHSAFESTIFRKARIRRRRWVLNKPVKRFEQGLNVLNVKPKLLPTVEAQCLQNAFVFVLVLGLIRKGRKNGKINI